MGETQFLEQEKIAAASLSLRLQREESDRLWEKAVASEMPVVLRKKGWTPPQQTPCQLALRVPEYEPEIEQDPAIKKPEPVIGSGQISFRISELPSFLPTSYPIMFGSSTLRRLYRKRHA